jgi:hypothetical protein
MSDPICGHDRESLRWALGIKSSIESGDIPFTMGGRLSGYHPHLDALAAIGNPEQLAEIVVELLRKCTSADVVVIAPNRSLHRTPSRLDYVVYWGRDHGGTIQIKPPREADADDSSKLLVMQQARAFARHLLDATHDWQFENALALLDKATEQQDQ